MDITLSDEINFSDVEHKILNLWSQLDAFKTALKQSENRKKYTFYDGPPFATGLPHYGHILAGTIKDIVTRYAHQSGFHVERRFGWDCHGVPIEYEIDKKLNISGPADVEKIGIAAYNNACRSIVSKYSKEWEETVTRLGRWIDFENDYKTMYPWFMESVWYVFKMIFEKGLVYRGVKVMPFSTACSTPLSNFEAKQNFKDVNDPAIVVSFPLLSDKSVEMLAWTTTPWTLPSNLGLCVNPDFEYVKIKHEKSGKKYILLESRISYVFKKDKVVILEKMIGKSLENEEYEPLFDYFIEMRDKYGAFKVMCDNYVTSDSGTGVVHQAPYFGEDDYRVCKSYGVIEKDSKVVCPVDECGKFTDEVKDFAGQYVKEADKEIMKVLKANNRLISQGSEKHSYPFCWRSDTPLLYKAVPSWFIRVESIVEGLLKSNDATYWVPDFVKNNRFGNWLKDARDWAISRNRYWGTPIPLWVSDDFEEVVCVGSIEELEQLSGVKAHDLHREYIDDIKIPSRTGRGMLHRVPQVFDCWFESGSMPYAQMHFPFSTTPEKFNEIFPADFIAEGLDQTRGWFYTLTVIGTILYGKSPFKNLIVNGIVLASDGQKMSKRLKNYPDPMLVIDKYGADALRLYLINSPVVRAQNLKFTEAGVKEVLREVFLPWYNASKFLINSSLLPLERKTNNGQPIMFRANEAPANTTNTMDRWIISFTQSLIRFFHEQMDQYRLDTVIPRLVRFIGHLTNWYVRMNRKRLRGETVLSTDDWKCAVHTLFFVLYQTTLLMAPFVPFITEQLYQKLKLRLVFEDENASGVVSNSKDSVHYLMLPKCNETLIDNQVERSVALMQTIVETGRKIREQEKLALKSPLMEAIVVSDDAERIEKDIASVKSYVLEELNIRHLIFSNDKKEYGVQLRAELNHRELGRRLKGDYQKVLKQSKLLTNEMLEEFQKSGVIEICGHKLEGDDLQVVAVTGESGSDENDSNNKYRSMGNSEGLLVLLDVSRNEDLIEEAVARELVNRIQRRRKELLLVPEDPITVYCYSDNNRVKIVLNKDSKHRAIIDRVVQQPVILINDESFISGNTCSILNDTTGVESEIKVDEDLVIKLWFSHDHSRLHDYNRQCKAEQPKIKNSGDCITVIYRSTGQEICLKPNPSMTWCELSRHVRVAVGWSQLDTSEMPKFSRADGGLVNDKEEKIPKINTTYYI